MKELKELLKYMDEAKMPFGTRYALFNCIRAFDVDSDTNAQYFGHITIELVTKWQAGLNELDASQI